MLSFLDDFYSYFERRVLCRTFHGKKYMNNIYKMRLRRTGKRGNKVRSRNTRKRQTLRRKKRQSRRKLRGGSGSTGESSIVINKINDSHGDPNPKNPKPKNTKTQ